MSTMTWSPRTHSDYDALKGFAVYTSDDEKLGTITEVCHPQLDMPQARGQHVFRVEPGTLKSLFTGQEEVFLSEQLISRVDPKDDKVILEVPKASIREQDWSRPRDFTTYRRV